MFEECVELDSPDFIHTCDISFAYNPLLKISLDDLYFPISIDEELVKNEEPKMVSLQITDADFEDNDDDYCLQLIQPQKNENKFIAVFPFLKRSSNYMEKFNVILVHIESLYLIQEIIKILVASNPDLFNDPENANYFNINNSTKMITYNPK